MSDLLPVEIWTRIFYMACFNDKCTGCSLSQTSRYFYAVSLPIRFYCVEVGGPEQVQSLADTLENNSLLNEHLRHLCIASSPSRPRPRYAEDFKPGDERAMLEAFVLRRLDHVDMMSTSQAIYDHSVTIQLQIETVRVELQTAFTRNVSRVLAAVAPSLHTLAMEAGKYLPAEFASYQFPALQELSLYGRSLCDILPASAPSVDPAPGLLSLRRLHCTSYFGHLPLLLNSAPSLTHLRLSDIDTENYRSHSDISAGLSRRSLDGQRGPRRPLQSIQQIIIQLDAPHTELGLSRMAKRLVDLVRRDHDRVLDVLDEPNKYYLWVHARAAWQDRTWGGKGCWNDQYEAEDAYSRTVVTKLFSSIPREITHFT